MDVLAWIFWLMGAFSMFGVLVSGILAVVNVKDEFESFSWRTLWNPANAILVPNALNEKGRRYRRLMLVFLIAAVLSAGHFALVSLASEKS